MFRLVVLPRPVFCHLVIVHALLNLRFGNRDYALQQIREVLVFLAVRFLVHGSIIAQSQEGDFMAPPKKAAGKRIVRLGPEPPDIQDVLDEISELRGSLDTLVALVYSLQQSIRDIKESIDELQD